MPGRERGSRSLQTRDELLSNSVRSASGGAQFWGREDGRVLVELKRLNNPQVEHGYRSQLERYKSAEKTTDAFFVIIDYGKLRIERELAGRR